MLLRKLRAAVFRVAGYRTGASSIHEAHMYPRSVTLRRLPILCGAIFALAGLPAFAQDLSGYDGPQLYRRFCASCHGKGGEGDGPQGHALPQHFNRRAAGDHMQRHTKIEREPAHHRAPAAHGEYLARLRRRHARRALQR